MNKEILKNIIIEGQELLDEVEAIPRFIELEEMARYVFVGIRQAGKSYLLYLQAKRLIGQGHSVKEMVYINFDDERLIGFNVEDFDTILSTYASMYEYKPILFLDEIQNIEGWEHFARRLANLKYQVYITGSNAKMLSKDIASTLGARYLERNVFPYSFSEFLTARGIDSENDSLMYGKSQGLVQRNLNDYFLWGGFPELLLFSNKRIWLNELYEKILLGDIVNRNGIRNENALRLTLKRLAENIKTPTSYNRLARMVKAAGQAITPTSVSDYINYCVDACMIFPMENWASKFVERNTVRKHYFIDNGLLNIFLIDSETSLLENLCALTLYRKSKYDPDYDVYFYNKEVELDFYLPKQKRGIQSCYSIADKSTLEREVKALTVFNKLYGLDRAEIVTYSEEEEIQTPELTIYVIPLAKWLLNKL
ncbi:MAG: ATP-binding protein [Bacteroides sp.]|nr:ATP-binding protein [Bacteroides sp.]MCM1379155.1 ATP-binding protein [Bacteroides sp.]MCM1445196.1 ATP-binding protein [Prevotella sp.]